MIPLDRIDCASSSSRSPWNARRGWRGLGSMASTARLCVGSSRAAGTGRTDGGRLGSSAFSPLPSALRELSGLFMVKNLFGEFDIAFGAAGTRVVADDGFAKAGGFGQAHTSRDDSS